MTTGSAGGQHPILVWGVMRGTPAVALRDCQPMHARAYPIAVGLRAIRGTGYGPAGRVTTAGTTRGQGIIGNSKRVNRTQVIKSASAANSPVRKHAHLAPPQPSTSVLAKPRTAMINTSQHNLRRTSEC